jgi:hypothetical protein
MKRLLLLLFLVAGTLCAQEAKVTPLMAKDLAGIPGKEATMITVDYAPGAKDAIHRHNAHVFVYTRRFRRDAGARCVKDKGAPVLVPAK